MSDKIILHHYPQSPFSEKVRVAFGIKGISWASVHIPTMMPKPLLMPLTGGYRKTPVMQIGADIYCDTQIILREIERRHPAPSIFRGKGLGYMAALWSDRAFFPATIPLIFGEVGDFLPKEFAADRAKLMPDRPFDTAAMRAVMPQFRDQWRAHAGLISDQLSDGRAFLSGDAPDVTDIHAHMNVWFLKGTLAASAEKLLKEFPAVDAWFSRITALGHGTPARMTGEEALDIARAATSATKEAADPNDPNGLKPGMRVSVTPDDYGRDPVTGVVVSSSAQHIAIQRSAPETGDVVVHFPRIGFVVKLAD